MWTVPIWRDGSCCSRCTGFFGARVYRPDMHSADVFLLPGGEVTVLGFGAACWVTEREYRTQLSFIRGVIRSDPAELTRIFLDLVGVQRGPDPDRLEFEIVRTVSVWLGALDDPRSTSQERSMAGLLIRFIYILHAHQVPLPQGIAGLVRMWISLDNLLRRIDPEIDIRAGLKRFSTQRSFQKITDQTLIDMARDTWWWTEQLGLLVPYWIASAQRSFETVSVEMERWKSFLIVLCAILAPALIAGGVGFAIVERVPYWSAIALAAIPLLLLRRWLKY